MVGTINSYGRGCRCGFVVAAVAIIVFRVKVPGRCGDAATAFDQRAPTCDRRAAREREWHEEAVCKELQPAAAQRIALSWHTAKRPKAPHAEESGARHESRIAMRYLPREPACARVHGRVLARTRRTQSHARLDSAPIGKACERPMLRAGARERNRCPPARSALPPSANVCHA